ncbi:DUF3015 family protein [Deltaproteobacteria bacterium TL4]
MKKTSYVFLIIMLTLIPFDLFARDSSDGCGLGWEVNGDSTFLATSTRGTTNATFSPSFSMTSGTSGCSKHSLVRNEAKGIHYTEANFSNLMMEMPMGNGEFLTGFAEVLGCGEVMETFGDVMQKNYETIYAFDKITPAEVYQNVIQQIQDNADLSRSCRLT